MSYDQAVSLSEVQINRMFGAYIKRKKFESKILLSELGKALDQVLLCNYKDCRRKPYIVRITKEDTRIILRFEHC